MLKPISDKQRMIIVLLVVLAVCVIGALLAYYGLLFDSMPDCGGG